MGLKFLPEYDIDPINHDHIGHIPGIPWRSDPDCVIAGSPKPRRNRGCDHMIAFPIPAIFDNQLIVDEYQQMVIEFARAFGPGPDRQANCTRDCLDLR